MQTSHSIYVSLWLLLMLLFFGFVAGVFLRPLLYPNAVISNEYRYTFELPRPDGTKTELQYGIWPELTRADYFNEVRNRFVEERASFVEANLTEMRLRVYHNGTVALEVPIKSKGRKGSWWETPSGLYSAQAKLGTHFSSFGQVYMPYSIPFQGNFFIHGWPYYADGTPVAEGYSGGCIRLEDVYAKQVYDLVEKGMPILVFEADETARNSFTYALNAPDISARSYLVADLDTNFLLLAGEPNTQVTTTLLAPLLMAVVASEHINMERNITATAAVLAGVEGSPIESGNSYRVYDLLHLLLQTGDVGAMQMFEYHLGDRRTVTLFNTKLKALGMEHTSLEARRAGEAWRMTTTASDMFLFAKYLLSNRSFILAMSTRTPNTAIYGMPTFGTGGALHPFASESLFIGGSMPLARVSGVEGRDPAAVALAFATPSGNTIGGSDELLSVFTTTFSDSERRLLFVALQAKDATQDTRNMRSFVRSMYR